MTKWRPFAAILLGLYTAFLLVITIGPIPQRLVGSEAPNGVLSLDTWGAAATWGSGTFFEFAVNVLLFVPWGVLALFAFGQRLWGLAAILGVGLTLGIEIAQIPLARISDPRDLVANTAGVLVGLGLTALMQRRRVVAAG